MHHLVKSDPVMADLVAEEEQRLNGTLNLIAAENHCPWSVNEALGSVLNTKTIEGYPGKRFHSGCKVADEVEDIAIRRAKNLFECDHANVQPHSGSSANLIVYFSALDVGDRILAMNLAHGGHLSHGHQASVTSRCFCFDHYGVKKNTEMIDYDQVRRQALDYRPQMIVAGASSYPRLIDYEKLSEIAKDVSALLLVDMAHIAGLVAAGVIPSPVPYTDFVTFTTYKTMMGGRGGVILCRDDFASKVDRTVFPGCQGTSPVNLIAAKAVTFKLAGEPEFRRIQQQTLDNAARLAAALSDKGYRIVTGGTENHQVILDVSAIGVTGAEADTTLESVGIIANRNAIPSDAEFPGKNSGVRLGTQAVSTRGMNLAEMDHIADLIDMAIRHRNDRARMKKIETAVQALCEEFPLEMG